MSALDVLDEASLHGEGQVSGVLKDILEVAKEEIDGGASKQDIMRAVLFGFDTIVTKHWKESRGAWTQCTKMMQVLNTCDPTAEQEGFLLPLGRYVDEKSIDKVSAKVANRTEHFEIEKDAAKRVLPSKAAAAAAAAAATAAAASLQRDQKRSLDQLEEMTEDDFIVKMPKLFQQFKKFKQDLAPAAELTARVETLERNITELWGVPFSMRGAPYTNIETLVQQINGLGQQLEKMERRIEKLEKK